MREKNYRILTIFIYYYLMIKLKKLCCFIFTSLFLFTSLEASGSLKSDESKRKKEIKKEKNKNLNG